MKKFVFLSILFAVVAVTFIGLIEGGEEFEFEEKHKLAQCMGKGLICGDKCLNLNRGKCQCGNDGRFRRKNGYYCCIPGNVTCSKMGSTVTCPEGKKLQWNETCPDQQGQCPVSVFSNTAITSACKNTEKYSCPQSNADSSKICSVQLPNVEDYCDTKELCPKANKGLHYQQCYDSSKSSSNAITCISRMDKGKDIFYGKQKGAKKRWNFYPLIKIKGGKLICQNEEYLIDEMCSESESSKKCTLNGNVIELEPSYDDSVDLCYDYSFWKSTSSRRCSSYEEYFYERTHPVLCNQETINCSETWSSSSKSYCRNTFRSRENCNSEKNFFCKSTKACIPKEKKCDGIVHCSEGEDESFDTCRNEYPEEATIKCIEDRAIGSEIMIMATPCDGVKECWNGLDEDCDENNVILIGVVAALVILTNCIYHYLKWYHLGWRNHIIVEETTYQKNNYRYLLGDDLAKLKNDTTQTQCAELLKGSPGLFSQVKGIPIKMAFNRWTENVSIPLTIVLTQLDLIKDLTFVSRIILILGGPWVVFNHPELFSSCVVQLFLTSVFGPQLLGMIRTIAANPPYCRDWRQVCGSIIMVLSSPFYMYAGHCKLAFVDLKIRISPESDSLIKEKEDLKRALHLHIKLELGLETVYQLAGQMILLIMAQTETPTQSGLESVFKKEISHWKGRLLLTASIILSFKSCISSHWRALTAAREHFPFKSRLVSSIYCFFGCLTKVTVIIMYFAGPLGLFNLLRHLQAEQYPWHENVLSLVNKDGTMVLGNNDPFDWKLVDSNVNDYTSYVGFSLRYYLLTFFIGTGIQMLVIFIAKSVVSKVFWNAFNFLEKWIHCLENTNVVHNAKEWDDAKGNAKEHMMRMQSNWLEGSTIIIINRIANFAFLFSPLYLVYKMQERHDLLSRTIGYLDKEQDALNTGYLLLIGSFLLVIFGTMIQMVCFWLYNGSCHPFANILKNYSNTLKYSKLDDARTLPKKLKNMVNGSLFLSDDPNKVKIVESSEEIIDWVPSANDVKTIPRKMMNIVNASLFLNNTPKPHLPWYKNKNTIVALVLLIMFVLLLIALLVALLLYPYQYVDEKNHYNEEQFSALILGGYDGSKDLMTAELIPKRKNCAIPDLPIGIDGLSLLHTNDDKIMVCGGSNNVGTCLVLQHGQWKQDSYLFNRRHNATGISMPDAIYMIGQTYGKITWDWLSTGSTTWYASEGVSDVFEFGCGVRLSEFEILLIGGYTTERRILKINFLTGTSQTVGHLHQGRYGHSCSLFQDTIFVTGGKYSSSIYLAHTEMIELKTLTSRIGHDLKEARAFHGLAVSHVNKQLRLLAIGGSFGEGAGKYRDSIEIWNPEGQSWNFFNEMKLSKGKSRFGCLSVPTHLICK